MVVLPRNPIASQQVLIHITDFNPSNRTKAFPDGYISPVLVINCRSTILTKP